VDCFFDVCVHLESEVTNNRRDAHIYIGNSSDEDHVTSSMETLTPIIQKVDVSRKAQHV
jgi:hypothetical protein